MSLQGQGPLGPAPPPRHDYYYNYSASPAAPGGRQVAHVRDDDGGGGGQPFLRGTSISRKPVPATDDYEDDDYTPASSNISLPRRVLVASHSHHQHHQQQQYSRPPSYELGTEQALSVREGCSQIPDMPSLSPLPLIHNLLPLRPRHVRHVSDGIPTSEMGDISVVDNGPAHDYYHDVNQYPHEAQEEKFEPLHYHHQPERASRITVASSSSHTHSASSGDLSMRTSVPELQLPRTDPPPPNSAPALGSDGYPRPPTHSPRLSAGGSTHSPSNSPTTHGGLSANHRRTPDSRPTSYVDLLNTPYAQQVAPAPPMNNASLRSAVGTEASLLDTSKTLKLYRANVKKTNDSSIQYEFAIFMVQASRDSATSEERADLVRESRQILHKLSDRGYPFAQYYLGDGYSSGLFNKGKQDWERAFPLFVAASKHGHAEAGYRAALCYEFGWGCRKDRSKAVQFYRAAASKNHPGAASRLGKACMTGDMGLGSRPREGYRWLKRAAESADAQYNSAPYELACLHENGFGDDIFKDEPYAAQLFTHSADLGHSEAALRLGQAYEHGLLSCPRDPALSVHFYNCAAQAGVPEAMMALCAWYFVGAEPVLDKDENEAYEWAKRAAESGFSKAQYAVGYFTEMGVGCRRDPLEANVWYVRAADQGDEKAKLRLQIIQDAAAGGGAPAAAAAAAVPIDAAKKEKKRLLRRFK